MNDSIQSCCYLWWMFPVLMMLLCFLMMRRWRGSAICGFGFRRPNDIAGPDSALNILDKRYAAGEIDEEEYEEKKRILSGSSGSSNTCCSIGKGDY